MSYVPTVQWLEFKNIWPQNALFDQFRRVLGMLYFDLNAHRSICHLYQLNFYLKSVETNLKDQSSWFNPVAVALDVRPKRVFQPVWTEDAFRIEFCGMCGIYTAAALYLKSSLHLKLYAFHKITNVNSSETLDWHLQHNNYARILRNEEVANAELCDHFDPSWFCGDLLWKTLLWVTMTTGALPAGEQMISIAYITLFSIPLSQGVACPGHYHSQQYKRCCSPGYQLQQTLPKTTVLETYALQFVHL